MGRGGARPGAGRKPSGKRIVQFWVSESEAEVLKKTLEECRKNAELQSLVEDNNKCNVAV